MSKNGEAIMGQATRIPRDMRIDQGGPTQIHYEMVVDEIATIRLRKVQAYGEDRYEDPDIDHAMGLSYADVYRKFIRIKHLISERKYEGNGDGETLEQAFKDLANYCIMGAQLLQQFQREEMRETSGIFEAVLGDENADARPRRQEAWKDKMFPKPPIQWQPSEEETKARLALKEIREGTWQNTVAKDPPATAELHHDGTWTLRVAGVRPMWCQADTEYVDVAGVRYYKPPLTEDFPVEEPAAITELNADGSWNLVLEGVPTRMTADTTSAKVGNKTYPKPLPAEKTNAKALPPRSLEIDQIAIVSQNPGETKALLDAVFGTTPDDWQADIATATGMANGRVVRNTASLSFNYKLIKGGVEFEVLCYGAGNNWLQDAKRVSGHSHFGVHVENLDAVRTKLLALGYQIAQEVRTTSHTNAAIAGKRTYKYCIFATHDILGFDLKLIERVNLEV